MLTSALGAEAEEDLAWGPGCGKKQQKAALTFMMLFMRRLLLLT